MELPASRQRIGVINALRAFAALAVAWGHFVAGQGKYLGASGKYGYLGVEIFFVISGFVIPWSLYRSRYVLRDYPRFLLKRNVRLYPPYLASIAVSILATNFVLAPLFHIPRITLSGRDLLLHLTYLNDVAGVRWVNVVYWTLAVEFQWYLLIGLLLPLLASGRRAARFAATSAMVLAYFAFPWDRLVFHYLPIFMIGVFVFQYRSEIIDLREMLGLMAVMVLAMLRPSGVAVVLVSVPTGLLIALSTFQSRAMDRVGDVSYSLYLLHLPIGVGVIGWLAHWLPFSGSYIGLLDAVGVAASMWAAWMMYQIIEKPSQEWSSAIRFARRAKGAPQPVAAAAGD
ncbi:MAG TPA: acyltransferase [Candidatus Binatia bacterium]|nr:acyltransferase [Candidatus Binatia bacterium]